MQNQTHAWLIKGSIGVLRRNRRRSSTDISSYCNGTFWRFSCSWLRPSFYLWGVRSRCVWAGTHRGMAWCPRSSDAWSMHTVVHMLFACCFLRENEGHGPALAAESPWQSSRGIYCLLPLLWDRISQDSCISSHLPLMFPKFNYHLMLFAASTLPLLWCASVHCGSVTHIFRFFFFF